MDRGIQCRGLAVSFRSSEGREKWVLEDLSVFFAAGRMAVIGGETGVGKSTLLHVLAGLLRPTNGEVLADGKPVSRWMSAHRDLWRRRVGIVFQSDQLLGDLTVMENVLLPLIPRGRRLSECRRLAGTALDRMAVAHLAAETARNLSGGERQRVAIARALVAEPPFVFADEPTAHQDGDRARAVLTTLAAAADAGAVVVVTAHDPRVFATPAACDRYRLEQGRLRTPA